MRRVLVLAVVLASAAPRAAVGDDPLAAWPADVRALASADPWERETAFLRLRRAGPGALARLQCLVVPEDPDLRDRLAHLERVIREDWARARVPVGMVYVPGGALLLGRPADGERPEYSRWDFGRARREVPGFYLDRTEVTIAAWAAWRAGLAEHEGIDDLPQPRADPDADGALPVTGVTFDDAERFAVEFRAGRLPTVDELEWAARGGASVDWPWGREMLHHRANLKGYGPGGPLPVGSYPEGVSPCGAVDLAGNVAEWTATQVDFARRDPRHLVFGGSFRDAPSPDLLRKRVPRAAYADRYRREDVGFRVAADVPPLPRP